MRERWVQVLLDGHPTMTGTADIPVAPVQPAPAPVTALVSLAPADAGKWKPVCGVPLDVLLEIEDRVGSVPLLVESMVDYMAPRASKVRSDLFSTPGAAAAVLSVKSLLEQGGGPHCPP